MPHRCKRVLSAVLPLTLLALAACDDSPTEPPNGPVPAQIEVEPGALTLTALGATTALSATVLDDEGEEIEGAEVSWSSSDETVATVGETGVVTAVGNGSATITVESGEVEETVEVLVEQVADQVVVDPDEVVLTTIGGTAQLSATVTDAEGAQVEGAVVIWSSSDESVATVSDGGLVEAVGGGDATITAQSGAAEGNAEVAVEL